jgi:hypothetical protein
MEQPRSPGVGIRGLVVTILLAGPQHGVIQRHCREAGMNGIIYVVGLIVVIGLALSFLGLR